MADETEVEIYVRKWLADERHYTIQKFGIELDDQHIKEWMEDHDPTNSYWERQFDNYLGRAERLSLDRQGGRQALAKFVATAVGMLEAAVRVYGPLPEPGVTSGENLDNLREL